MSENRKQRQRPRCGRCLHPGFVRGTAPSGRPSFTCDKCGHYWTNGKSGGEYVGHAINDTKTAVDSASVGRGPRR